MKAVDPKPNSAPNSNPNSNPDADADGSPSVSSTSVQGEGDYEAARRHRASLEAFVASGKVEPAARAATPDSSRQAQDLKQAEDEGRAHAKK